MGMSKIEKIRLEIHGDDRGSLVAFGNSELPIEMKRVFFMYGTKEGVHRGIHAHKKCNQILICTSGSCKVLMDDGKQKKVHELSKPNEGLYVPCNMWREMYDFSEGAVLMAIADAPYDENDYIRNYDEFLKYYHIQDK